jgi:hypothetical protein
VQIVSYLLSEDKKRRVAIFRRNDGNFGLREEYWYENIYDRELVWRGWAPLADQKSIFVTEAVARREALAAFSDLNLEPVLDDSPRQP